MTFCRWLPLTSSCFTLVSQIMIMHIDNSPSTGNIKTLLKNLGPLKEPRPAASDSAFTQDLHWVKVFTVRGAHRAGGNLHFYLAFLLISLFFRFQWHLRWCNKRCPPTRSLLQRASTVARFHSDKKKKPDGNGTDCHDSSFLLVAPGHTPAARLQLLHQKHGAQTESLIHRQIVPAAGCCCPVGIANVILWIPVSALRSDWVWFHYIFLYFSLFCCPCWILLYCNLK